MVGHMNHYGVNLEAPLVCRSSVWQESLRSIKRRNCFHNRGSHKKAKTGVDGATGRGSGPSSGHSGLRGGLLQPVVLQLPRQESHKSQLPRSCRPILL